MSLKMCIFILNIYIFSEFSDMNLDIEIFNLSLDILFNSFFFFFFYMTSSARNEQLQVDDGWRLFPCESTH